MGRAWLNPAGGLRYHVRALLSGRDWQPFRDALQSWLAEFNAPTERAVLVGPSAGHTLPDAFLRRFSTITVLEPDPIAGMLLGRRLRKLGVRTHIERSDLLIGPLLEGGHGLVDLLGEEKAACLVFCNVLGQTRFLVQDPDFGRFKRAFRERVGPLLANRPWLSVHDRLSGRLAPNFAQPYRTRTRLDDESVLEKLYPTAPTAMVELFDHESDGFFDSAMEHTYFHWRIDRSRYHLIEGVSSQACG